MRAPATAILLVALLATGCSAGDRDESSVPTSVDAQRPTTTERTVTSATTSSVPEVLASPADVEPPRSAAAAATRIAHIERALRRRSTPPDQLPALGWEQEVIYRTLTRNDAWFARVLRSVPDDIAVIVAANVGGTSSISALAEPPTSLPATWRIVAPPAAETLLRHYREAEASSGIPWPYLAAINLVETRMGRIIGDSSAGAQGPMQFIPSSWDAFGNGGDVHDPRDAILAAGRYLAAAGGPSDMKAAIFAYNHSNAYVDAVTRYASLMVADDRAYLGYYHWQVSYRTVDGLYLLPEGYPEVAARRVG